MFPNINTLVRKIDATPNCKQSARELVAAAKSLEQRLQIACSALQDASMHLDRAETTLLSASRGRLTPDEINDAGYEAGAAVARARAAITKAANHHEREST
jgi:hypothetical protein